MWDFKTEEHNTVNWACPLTPCPSSQLSSCPNKEKKLLGERGESLATI